jgi:predicted ATPase
VTKKKTFYVAGKQSDSGSQIRQRYSAGDDKIRRQMISDLYPKAKNPAKVKQLLDKYLTVKEDVDFEFEELLTEGVHDQSIFKAVFLAGGPGSGKDYVLDNTLAGHGLTEMNSDKALEFLMDKEGLDKTMPASEEERKDIVRGRAKNITELRQRLAILGRNGLSSMVQVMI